MEVLFVEVKVEETGRQDETRQARAQAMGVRGMGM